MKIALNNKWKWCIVFRAFFIWIWSPRIFQFSYSPMSNSLTSENMKRGFAHRIFDKLCPKMDGIWSIIILNFVPMENFPMENCLLKIFYWSIGAKLGCRGRIFFLFYQTNFHLTVLRHFWLHGNMFFIHFKCWQNIVPTVCRTQLNTTTPNIIITRLTNAYLSRDDPFFPTEAYLFM